MRPVRVDVVIPNWNGEALLARCLEALAAQTYTDHRAIVVDNGSSDGSRAVAEARGATWLPLGENLGFPAAVNAGIAAGDAPLVALLNNDALPEAGWLAALVAALEADPSILRRSRMLFAEPAGVINAAGDAFDVRGRGGYNRGIGEQDGPRFDEPRLVFGACAGAAIYRRRCSPTSASSTSASSWRSRTSTSTCAPRSPGTAASTCRLQRSCTSAAPPPALSAPRSSAATARGW